jgi:hypothetical protein
MSISLEKDMTGKTITQQQVNLYMSYRTKNKQNVAAAKSGISERSARRIDKGEFSLSKAKRNYRTRVDPFDGDFETYLIPLLSEDPLLQPITLLDKLEELFPNKYDKSKLRTLQRRVNKWLATDGPDKEVIFRQTHEPGAMALCDYTWMNKLEITIAGELFKHKLFHYRLIFSSWTYAQVVFGGESFESLSSGLQNAFWRSGGVPQEIRTDSLSAAFNNHYEQQVLTERYHKLCKFYHVRPSRNNRGIAHENGGIESPNGHLKNKIDQQLRLRGSRDFAVLNDYQSFIESIVSKINRQCQTRFTQEREALGSLPKRRTHDYSEQHVKVTSCSTINIKRVTYTVPSRLIGAKLLIQLYDDRLDIFHGHQRTLTLQRVYAPQSLRLRAVNYKHIIHSLAKKPNAFKCSQLRDDIVPAGDFTLIWQAITANGVTDEVCRYMVDLLLLAHNYECEKSLGRFVLDSVEQNSVVTLDVCRKRFVPQDIDIPMIKTKQHQTAEYDCLLEVANG